ncbi:MAG: DUF4352 domain-containing protein, partial [Bacilli bacterium]
ATKETKKDEGPQVFNIGDVIEVEDFKITVLGTRRDMGKEYLPPTDGFEFYYVNISVENISKKDQLVSSSLFAIYNDQGQKMEMNYFANTQGNLFLDTISSGRSVIGEYAIEVPIGAVGYELEFDANMFTTGTKILVKLD